MTRNNLLRNFLFALVGALALFALPTVVYASTGIHVPAQSHGWLYAFSALMVGIGVTATRKGPSGPAGVLAYSATITPASLASLATVENTVTCTGVKVGDVIVATPESGLQSGLVFAWGRVSAADTVKIAIGNMTAGALTPTSQTWDIRAIRS